MRNSPFVLTLANRVAVRPEIYQQITMPPAERLHADLVELYGQVRSIDGFGIRELWVIVRDVVSALDEWSSQITPLTSEQKRDLAQDVLWRFIETHGGLPAMKKLIGKALDRVLPGFIAKKIASMLLTEKVVRGSIRLVLEFAVSEIREIAARTKGS